MRNKIFVAVFFCALFAIMISAPTKWVLAHAGVLKNENVGNVIQVDKVHKGDGVLADVLNGVEEIKRDLTDIYINYIPFYVDVTSIANKFTQDINAPMASFLMEFGNSLLPDEPWEDEGGILEGEGSGGTDTEQGGGETETPAFKPKYNVKYLDGDERYRYYVVTARFSPDEDIKRFYVRVSGVRRQAATEKMLEQVERINSFAASTPDVNWYVYAVTGFENAPFCDEVLKSESKTKLFNDFFEKLDPSIQGGYLEVNSVADRLEKFFTTDHHWNVNGYTEAYSDIAAMLAENYPDIEAKDCDIVLFDDISFVGSNGQAVTNPNKLYDKFAVADYHLPEHDVKMYNIYYANDELYEESMAKYLAGNYETDQNYNHYICFQPIAKEITYPENNTGRRLLIIGYSYSPPLMEVIASHFDVTYVRYVDSNGSMPDIDYDVFVKEKGITDVLVLENAERAVFDCDGNAFYGME